jgi:UDP-N-acetylmuramoylalanine-D-glutamate ligase
MNFLIRGKGKVGRSVAELLDSLRYTYQIFDDNDKVDNIKNLISWADKIVVSPGIKPTHTIYQL